MDAIEIECISCGREFEFTVDEQLIYRKKQFDTPKRCPECRKSKGKVKAQRNSHGRRKDLDWSQAFS